MDSAVLNMNCDYDLLLICRSCRRDDQVLHPIFESTLKGYNNATLQEMFTSCTQLQIKSNDGMPPNVCTTCLADINVAYIFLKRSEQSNMLLKEYLSRKKMELRDLLYGPKGVKEKQVEPLDIKPEDKMSAKSKHKPTRPLFDKLTPPKQEKKFVCRVCQKAFFKLHLFDRHVKTHSLQNKFDFSLCHKKVKNLSSDMKNDTKDSKSELTGNLLCKYCGRGFNQSASLTVHMQRHTGERPYECDVCDKAFAKPSELQIHRKTHTGEKPCLCTICGKAFMQPDKLARHMRIHTEIRPYSCTRCDRSFAQERALKIHQRVKGHLDDDLSVSSSKSKRLETTDPETVHQGATEDGRPKVVKQAKSKQKAMATTPPLPVCIATVASPAVPSSPALSGN